MKLFSLKRIFLAFNLLLLSFFSINAYALRCGTTLVNVGDSIEQVTEACGEPDKREEWTASECGFNNNYFCIIVPMAIFTYSTPTGSSYNVLHFTNHKLTSIDFKL